MALQVWIPLTNNLENKGLNNAVVTNTNASLNNNGKLGKCYQFAGGTSNAHLYLPTTVPTTTKNWSYCCWAKIISFPVGYAPLYTQRTTVNNTSRNIFIKTAEIIVDNGARATISKTLPTLSNWNHFAVVCTATQVKVYINGTLFDSKTITNTAYANMSNDATIGNSKSGAGNTVNGGNLLNGYLNDIRIYDHCLSQQEIREISKGLILHYPLDNIYNTTLTNLIHVGDNCNGYMVNGVTNTKMEGYYNHTMSKTGDGSSSWITPDSETVGALTSGKKYLWSFDVRVNACSSAMKLNARTAGYENDTRSGNTFAEVVKPDFVGAGWKHFYAVREANSSDTSARIEFVSPNMNGNGTVYSCDFDLRNMMIVEVDYDVPFINNNFKDSVVHDISGFGNHSVKMSSITPRQGGARYGYNTYFSNTSYICGPYPNTIKPDVFTISFWICLDVASMQYALDCDEGGGFETGVSSQKARISMYMSSAWRALSGATTLALNTWYHLCFTFDKTTVKIYVNGNLDASQDLSAYTLTYNSTAPWTLNANPNNVGSFESLTFGSMSTGQLSDVRIYTTTLSADDVKLLYNRGASIDNAGNLHCGELVEDNTATKQQVKKNTQVKSRFFSELPLKYDDTIYVEPDGSMWVRIVRQNAPGTVANNFASTDSFTTSVYKNVNTWFYGVMCNYVNKWEFMCKQKAQTANNETKFRWVQSVNPMTADMTAIAAATVTKNTSSGYTATGSGYTGIYAKKSTSYITTYQPSATNNTWGRFGQWAQYQSGLAGTNGVVVTTGYSDLYLRIDNVTFVNLPANTKTQFLKSGDINSTEIYEQ